MNSKQLISLLQKLDPTGETTVCVDNMAISGANVESAYWDGCLCEITDKIRFINKGVKLCLYYNTISGSIMNNPKIEAEYNDFTIKYKDIVEFDRKETIDIKNNIEREDFAKFCKENNITPWRVVNYDDPMPEDIIFTDNKSWHDRRIMQWERECLSTM
jgi:hypothetical protein